MTAILSVLALVISAVGLGYLSATDPKRRRAFKLETLEERLYKKHAFCAIFIPFPLLIIIGNYAALVIWMGGVTIIGWVIACLTPPQQNQLKWTIEFAWQKLIVFVLNLVEQTSSVSFRVKKLFSQTLQINTLNSLNVKQDGKAQSDSRIQELEDLLEEKDKIIKSLEER